MHTIEQMQQAFCSLLPKLTKRIREYAKRFADGEDAHTELLSSAWINFRQRAISTGEFLPAHKLAFVAYLRLASGRTLIGYSVADAMAPAAFKLGRCRRIYLSELAHRHLS